MSVAALVPATSPRDRYLRTLDSLMPELPLRERDMRCSIMMMRDQAAVAMNHCGADAYPVLAAVAKIAETYSFHPLEPDALAALRYQLVRLLTCASGLETINELIAGEDDMGDAGASAG